MSDEENEARKKPGTTARLSLGALSGLPAGGTAPAAAELVAAAVRPQAGPVVAVGGAAIDRTPAAVKDWAIRDFGTDDELVLQLGILAVLALFALTLGVLAVRHRRTGAAGVLVVGAVGAEAATSRPDSTSLTDALPSVLGSLAGAALLYCLVGRLPAAHRGGRAGAGEGWDRCRFVLAATAAAAASAGEGALGRALNGAGGQEAVASRKNTDLPPPASRAPAVPRGAQVGVAGVSPFITPNADFYRVDTALVVPRVDATAWRLRIQGDGVTREKTLTFDDSLRRGLTERDITRTCVSNEVGGPYVGNARWTGVRLADLPEECGVRPPSRGGPADQLVARSVDGMTMGSPVEDVMDGRDAMLAVGMNGEPLPFDHGFPVRMLVPGLYGYVSACKRIEDIELTTFDAYDAYWVERDWAREAAIRTQSRIDTPKPFARPKTGAVMVAGVARAQHRGVDKVEVRVDDGPRQEATLAAEDTRGTWRQWSYAWQATRGGHTLTGELQTEKRTRTVPDGAGGWHSVVVTVE
ncbi:molybdopterin-dependent oxidoreductase [Streptomyces sp. NPDC058847]|uniref:molybdopterin-dependent oxidoreductase n=1 Tax=Streptomyces sp. NPDC058847 TaxID=3346649 RepID=UPI0036ACB7E5